MIRSEKIKTNQENEEINTREKLIEFLCEDGTLDKTKITKLLENPEKLLINKSKYDASLDEPITERNKKIQKYINDMVKNDDVSQANKKKFTDIGDIRI